MNLAYRVINSVEEILFTSQMTVSGQENPHPMEPEDLLLCSQVPSSGHCSD
jgi:hypothetical protein